MHFTFQNVKKISPKCCSLDKTSGITFQQNILAVKIDSPYYCNFQIRHFLENFDENGNKTQHMSVSCTSSQVLFYRIVTCLPSTFRDKWCLRHHCFRQRKVPNICQRKSNWSGGLVWTVRVVSDFQRPLLSSLSIIITLGTFFNFDFMNVCCITFSVLIRF